MRLEPANRQTRHGQPDRGTVPLSCSLEEGPRLAWPGAAGRRGPFRLVWSAAVIGNSGEVMQLTSRRFLIAKDGVLYRLADATFTRMLQNPREHAFAILAGQRVRMASLIVELIGGKPARVVRSTFATLTFDEDGHMDLGTFTRQQWALAESALDPAFVRTKPEEKVLDASARFIAQGGKWRPSNSLARAINAAALGQVRCRRL